MSEHDGNTFYEILKSIKLKSFHVQKSINEEIREKYLIFILLIKRIEKKRLEIHKEF